MAKEIQDTVKGQRVEAELTPIKPLEKSEKPEVADNGSAEKGIMTAWKLLRQQASPELLAIGTVYFVQGFVSLTMLAVSYFLKDNLDQGPAQVAFLEGLGAIPWIIKPLYGFASDSFPIFGYRRRSYLVICGLLGSSAWLLLGTSAMSPWSTVTLLVLTSVSTACSDVVVDSVIVERARGEPQETSGSLQSLCWASFAVGGIVSSYYGGYLVDKFGPQFVFCTVSVLPLLVALSAFLINESQTEGGFSPKKKYQLIQQNGNSMGEAVSVKEQISALWEAFKQKSIYLPALFIFVYESTPSASSAMFFFETNALHFSPEFMGRVTLIGQIATLCGVGIYRFYLRSVPLKKIFKWSCILSTVIGMSQLILITRVNTQFGLSDQLFVLGDSAILNVIGRVAFMPVLVLAARMCPERVEATLFALLMSISNAGGVLGGLMGAGMTNLFGVTDQDFSNLWILISLCVFSNLLPLFLVKLIPESDDQELDVSLAKDV